MCICFRKSVDDDDDQSAATTNKSIVCNTIFNELLYFNVIIPRDFTVLQSDVLDLVVQYDSNVIGSDHSNVSDALSECESLNEYRKSFLMKDEPWYITKGVSKTINNNSELFSVNELEAMNEARKTLFYDFVYNI